MRLLTKTAAKVMGLRRRVGAESVQESVQAVGPRRRRTGSRPNAPTAPAPRPGVASGTAATSSWPPSTRSLLRCRVGRRRAADPGRAPERNVRRRDRSSIVGQAGWCVRTNRPAGVIPVKPSPVRRCRRAESVAQRISRSPGSMGCPRPSGNMKPNVLGESSSTRSVPRHARTPARWKE